MSYCFSNLIGSSLPSQKRCFLLVGFDFDPNQSWLFTTGLYALRFVLLGQARLVPSLISHPILPFLSIQLVLFSIICFANLQLCVAHMPLPITHFSSAFENFSSDFILSLIFNFDVSRDPENVVFPTFLFTSFDVFNWFLTLVVSFVLLFSSCLLFIGAGLWVVFKASSSSPFLVAFFSK